jgi:translation initiation factor 2 subunit 2
MEYDKLLERAYSLLPDKAGSGVRFEMPVVESLTQGNKTIIKNFDEIVQKLRRTPEELMKYLSRELAVPMNREGAGLVLQGKFYDRVLNDKLKRYVESYVICKECKKADTKIVEVERGVKVIVCEACGARFSVRG